MHQDTSDPILRILCVDDDPQAADILGVLLELTGFEARVAYDGVSALAIARDFRPDAAILDLTMPGMDGYELARRLLERDSFRTPPVLIALTGWSGDDVRRRTAEAGFDLHLTKPVDPDQLALLLADIVILRSPVPPSETPNGR